MAANSRIMTLFLWHMMAYLLAILLLWPLGFGRQLTPTVSWWLERPLWIAVPSAILAALVAVFGRFEGSGHQRASAERIGRRRAQDASAA